MRRPTPLSTKVTKSKSTVMSQSALIMTIMEKLDEIEADEKLRFVFMLSYIKMGAV